MPSGQKACISYSEPRGAQAQGFGGVLVIDPQDGTHLADITLPITSSDASYSYTDAPQAISLSPDAKTLYAAGGHLYKIDLTTNTVVGPIVLPVLVAGDHSFIASPQQASFCAAPDGTSLFIRYSGSTRDPSAALPTLDPTYQQYQTNPFGTFASAVVKVDIATGSAVGIAVQFPLIADRVSGTQYQSLVLYSGGGGVAPGPWIMQMSQDGHYLYVAGQQFTQDVTGTGRQGLLKVDASTLATVAFFAINRPVSTPFSPINAFDLSSDGSLAFAADENDYVYGWNTATGAPYTPHLDTNLSSTGVNGMSAYVLGNPSSTLVYVGLCGNFSSNRLAMLGLTDPIANGSHSTYFTTSSNQPWRMRNIAGYVYCLTNNGVTFVGATPNAAGTVQVCQQGSMGSVPFSVLLPSNATGQGTQGTDLLFVRPWAGASTGSSTGLGPSNAHQRNGPFHRVSTVPDGFGNNMLTYWRSNKWAPEGGFTTPLVTPAPASGVTDSHPRIAADADGRLHIVWERDAGSGPSVYRVYSDDDGSTWINGGSPEMAIAGGAHPDIAAGWDGVLVIAAVVVSGSTHNIQAQVQYPGNAAPSTAFTLNDDSGNPLQVADDSFGISHAPAPHSPWVLSAVIDGDAGSSEWQSWGDFTSWKRVS
jgi:hypothetical protein